MKKSFLMFALMTLCMAMPSYADWQAKTDTIWPGRHYRELNGIASGSQRSNSYISWSYTEGTVLVYGIHFPKGHVRADALFTCKSGRNVTFGVRIVHPATGTVVLDNTATSTTTTTAEQTMEIMPDTEMPYDGWYRFELTCPNGETTLDRLSLLLFQRTSTLSITDSEIFMAPSVHLWWSTQVPGAPSGQSYNWTYLEVMYPSSYRQPATYQMAIGTDGMYSGIQMPSHSDGSYGHSVLFSVWDNGDVDKDKNLPDIMRSAAVDLGPDAYATRFGAEGTGSSIRYYRDNLWEFDHWIQFLYNVRPDIISVKNDDGTVTEYETTLQSVWFKMAEENDWHYMGTLRMAGANRLTSGIYSFLENFGESGGHLMRRCYFRNGAMRSAANGKWYALNHAGFGNTQNNGNRYSRYDFGHGVTGLYDNAFYLETGGYMGKRDSLDTYPAPKFGEMPWVDTINIDRLERRVDQGVVRSQAKAMQFRIDATRTVSDPSTWKVISYSDEETVGEGDNGRASMIIDGEKSTYYHNKWKNGTVNFPHTFVIEAPDTVTVTSLALYQSRESSYRAKTMQLSVSDNNRTWKTISASIAIEDSEYPIVQLPKAATGKYFRLRFMTGYGSNLLINELSFMDEYRLEDLLKLTQQIIDESDQWGGYNPADLESLLSVYADGTCTDTIALRSAIEQTTTTAQPLTYGVVNKAESFTPLAVYQLHNLYGYGDVIATPDDAITITGSNATNALEAYQQPTTVSNPYCNWMILRSDKYNEYYLYNLGSKKFLNSDGSALSLTETPMPIGISKSGDGFIVTIQSKKIHVKANAEAAVVPLTTSGNTCLFQLRTNQYLRPDEDVAFELSSNAEHTLHDNSPEALFLRGIETYSKAFVAQPDTESKLIKSSTYLTSNANTNEQSAHNLAKLLDGKIDTYYETWYSNITWPEEMSYLQGRLTKAVNAFAFSFTPSQHEEYGRTDIPSDIDITVSSSTRNFLTVARLTDGLPTSISESYTSPVIFTDGNTRFVRLNVMQTLGNRENSRVFAMSEFQMHDVIIDEGASPYYFKPGVKEAFDALQTELQTMRTHISSGIANTEDCNALRQAIELAEQALDDATEIKSIHPDLSTKDEVGFKHGSTIVNLSGQRVGRMQKGIYIVNGRKVAIK